VKILHGAQPPAQLDITWLYPALDAPLCRKPVDVDRVLRLVAERCVQLSAHPA
jgi:hypothetical protein